MQSANKSPQVIKLNVGGTPFSTSTVTLLKAPSESILHAIGSQLASHLYQPDGSIFIDRDPSHFRIILNFLRDGNRVALPLEHRQRSELAVEADFYGLNSLSELISKENAITNLPGPTGINNMWEISKMERAASYRSSTPQEVLPSPTTSLTISKPPPQALCYMCKSSIDSEVRHKSIRSDLIRP